MIMLADAARVNHEESRDEENRESVVKSQQSTVES